MLSHDSIENLTFMWYAWFHIVNGQERCINSQNMLK